MSAVTPPMPANPDNRQVLRLAVPTPLRSLFDYLPPEGSESANWQPGQRLQLPFGRRELTGYLVEVVPQESADDRTLKAAIALLDPNPLIPPTLLKLCLWAAQYYHHPSGEVLAAAFPKSLREGREHRSLAQPGWRLTTRGKGLPEGALARSPKQAVALAMLQDADTVSTETFKQAQISPAVLKALLDKTLVERCEIALEATKASAAIGLELNDEQAAALEALIASEQGFSCHLLEGVTGSGKTEVYLQMIARCLERGQQALILIPEIGLTPQTLARFSNRFNANIVVLHSGLGDNQRYQAWEAARDGSAHIVIGTRSAIFTPLLKPGLIVVDEEHDSAFKQQDGFRYNARDVAVKRAQLENCTVILGSATPALETLHNALQGRYQHHRLEQRAGSSQLPQIKTLDLRRSPLNAGLSEALIRSIESTLGAGQQCLLFLNRRGYAPTLQCHDCGWIAECKHCDARLTLHRRKRRLCCHHCGASQGLPSNCPSCRSEQLLTMGLGTEQTEDYLRQRFPNWPIYRVDSDSMSGRETMAALVDQINEGEPCILLGTQMLTKGHHFPAVSLVAVIDMDAMLFSTDFRGEERSAQLLTQVAGRAGRADIRGEVLLQTHQPEDPVLLSMLQQNYHQLALSMLQQRQSLGMPPSGQLLMLRTDCSDANTGEQFLRQLRSTAQPHLQSEPTDPVQIIGPLPAPMPRRAGKFRSQMLVRAKSRATIQRAAAILVDIAQQQKGGKGLNWSIDVDPQDLF